MLTITLRNWYVRLWLLALTLSAFAFGCADQTNSPVNNLNADVEQTFRDMGPPLERLHRNIDTFGVLIEKDKR